MIRFKALAGSKKEVSVQHRSWLFSKEDITVQYLFILRSKNLSLAFPGGWIHRYTALLCNV